ncbi:MAG: recombinase family protein [Syntrophobacteraceae bacterium]
MKALAYLRVSTEDQVESGAGLSAQLNACESYSARIQIGIAETFSDEGISGACGLEKRPALLEAIGRLGKGDILLVAKRDRLGRDPIKVAMIESAVVRKGARVVSAAGEGTEADDPSSILMRRMIDAFAEYERLIIGARTKAAMQAKKGKGELVGSVPYGYRLSCNGTRLELHPEEQRVIAEARRLKAAGLSLRVIARELARLGLKSRTGQTFEAVQIQRMLAA